MDPQGNLTSAVWISKKTEHTIAEAMLDYRAELAAVAGRERRGPARCGAATLSWRVPKQPDEQTGSRAAPLRSTEPQPLPAMTSLVIDTTPSPGIVTTNPLVAG